jgi:hypothetical protein
MLRYMYIAPLVLKYGSSSKVPSQAVTLETTILI